MHSMSVVRKHTQHNLIYPITHTTTIICTNYVMNDECLSPVMVGIDPAVTETTAPTRRQILRFVVPLFLSIIKIASHTVTEEMIDIIQK